MRKEPGCMAWLQFSRSSIEETHIPNGPCQRVAQRRIALSSPTHLSRPAYDEGHKSARLPARWTSGEPHAPGMTSGWPEGVWRNSGRRVGRGTVGFGQGPGCCPVARVVRWGVGRGCLKPRLVWAGPRALSDDLQ